MILKGRDIRFLRTVNAACEISDLCPDGKMQNIGQLFAGSDRNRIENMAKIIHFLNKGYEEAKAFDEEGYEPNPVTVKELLLLDDNTFNQLFVEASDAFYGDVQTVEVEEPKKKEEEKAETLD